MPQEKISNLITDLHERFGDDLSSPEQQALMQALQSHAHDLGAAEPVDPSFQETLNLLMEEVEIEHPQAAAILREVMDALKNMGI